MINHHIFTPQNIAITIAKEDMVEVMVLENTVPILGLLSMELQKAGDVQILWYQNHHLLGSRILTSSSLDGTYQYPQLPTSTESMPSSNLFLTKGVDVCRLQVRKSENQPKAPLFPCVPRSNSRGTWHTLNNGCDQRAQLDQRPLQAKTSTQTADRK